MERIESLPVADFLYRLLYAGTFSAVMLFCCSGWLGISDVNWRHTAVLLFSVVALSAVCLLGGRQRVYAAAVGIAMFLFLFLSVGSERSLVFFERVLDLHTAQYLPLAGDMLSAEYEILPGEQIYIELGRVFLLVVICYPTQLLLGKNIYLKIVSADIIGGLMLYMKRVPKPGVVFFVLYIGLIMAEWSRARLKKMKKGDAQAYVLGILPFLAAYVLLLSFMPMQEKPYDWQWAKDVYRSAEEKITMYAENFGNIGIEYFGETTSGFSDEGRFFPDIIRNDRQLMTLGIGKQKDMPVYLTGKVFDSFSGREWENRREDADTGRSRTDRTSRSGISESERILDLLETVYALGNYTESLNPVYYRNIRMDVSYQYFHTDYLLAPSKTWRIGEKEKKIKYHYNGPDIVFDRKAGYGTEYTLQFCRLDMEREELYRFLIWNLSDDVKTWGKVVRQYSGESISIEELYAYREMMKEQYLPETDISPEAEEWLGRITAGAKTDVEKLTYIEDALSGMAYNTNPGTLPDTVTDGKSFLDYFLLENQEGYCVHFATAFVLLARAEGFPARYVQGFCVPTVSGDATPVYSDMAHAWPEVYFEGKGWIPFEPTPGFGVNRYAVQEEDTDSSGWPSYTGNYDHRPQENIAASESEKPEEMIPEEQKPNRILPHLVRALWILLIGSILAVITDRLIEKYRDEKRDLSEKYRLAVMYNFQILAMLGYKRAPEETYHELAERIGTSYTFIEVYEKFLYGSLDIDEQILNEVLAEREQLFAQLKKHRGKTYLLCRIRLYIVRHR